MKPNKDLLNLCNNIKKLMADNNVNDTKIMTSLTLVYLHWYFNVNISSLFKEEYEIIERNEE